MTINVNNFEAESYKQVFRDQVKVCLTNVHDPSTDHPMGIIRICIGRSSSPAELKFFVLRKEQVESRYKGKGCLAEKYPNGFVLIDDLSSNSVERGGVRGGGTELIRTVIRIARDCGLPGQVAFEAWGNSHLFYAKMGFLPLKPNKLDGFSEGIKSALRENPHAPPSALHIKDQDYHGPAGTWNGCFIGGHQPYTIMYLPKEAEGLWNNILTSNERVPKSYIYNNRHGLAHDHGKQLAELLELQRDEKGKLAEKTKKEQSWWNLAAGIWAFVLNLFGFGSA